MRAPLGVTAVSAFIAVAGIATADEAISLEEWRALAIGKTVHYSVDGKPAGREYYTDDGAFAVFQAPDGACVEGPWAHDDGRYCFWYGTDFQCFYHWRRGGRIITQSDTGGQEQVIERIEENEPLFCSPG